MAIYTSRRYPSLIVGLWPRKQQVAANGQVVTIEQARKARFVNHSYQTDDPLEIEKLDKLVTPGSDLIKTGQEDIEAIEKHVKTIAESEEIPVRGRMLDDVDEPVTEEDEPETDVPKKRGRPPKNKWLKGK